LARVQYYLNRLSAGRLLVALRSGEHDYDSSREVWLASPGRRRLSLPASGYEGVPTMDQQVVVQAKRDCGGS
jgi:hypothetical protein